jgi:hypothetical protein
MASSFFLATFQGIAERHKSMPRLRFPQACQSLLNTLGQIRLKACSPKDQRRVQGDGIPVRSRSFTL